MIYKTRVQRSYGAGGYAVYLVRYDRHSGKTWIGKPARIEWEDFGDGWRLPDAPTLIFADEEIAAFAEGLMACDALPKEMVQNKRELEATKEHLEDLRKIAFNELDIHYGK